MIWLLCCSTSYNPILFSPPPKIKTCGCPAALAIGRVLLLKTGSVISAGMSVSHMRFLLQIASRW
ncbi:hypothetical protein B0T26DRAFT_721073 [Lasiosphaeria miniovina]|uniref:Uncharacterized protein n=1 Tax=Lasiosphaeria miniovina TaxID=1954250 RepID=A0AA40A4Q1_9PEZI|nr:uncharacterized protein B0T26DRAFT_721073 [Lasiosphaeria miniovina]KAK0709286.1 hypothetical protein B0T26DRAFT_721073 [Lasiosphaeria miniovina]